MEELKFTRRTLLAGLTGLLLLPAGCAKAPSGAMGSTSPASGPQMFVTLTVAGSINPLYYYFVLFNVNNAPGPTGQTGPVPVVAPALRQRLCGGRYHQLCGIQWRRS